MLRHDGFYLQLIHKHFGIRSYRMIKELPFFYFQVPEKWLLNISQVSYDILDKILPEGDALVLENIIPFPKFSFILNIDPCLHVFQHLPTGGFVIDDFFLSKHYKQDRVFLNHGPDGKNIGKGLWNHTHKIINDGKGTAIYECRVNQYIKYKNPLCNMELQNYRHIPDIDTLYKRNEIDCESIVKTILALFISSEEQHQLVRTKVILDKKANKNNKNYSKYSAKYHYVYLDGPPANTLSKSEASGIKRRGHARRAHWHRLTHNRFKNHPQFGDRIRIKASWVGPKEWADEGKIYTLHEPEEL